MPVLRQRGAAAARRKPLQFEDIWELPEGDKVEHITAEFERHWAEEMQKPQPSLVRSPVAAGEVTACGLKPLPGQMPSPVARALACIACLHRQASALPAACAASEAVACFVAFMML